MIVMNLSPEGRFRRAVRLSLALTVMGAVVPSLAVAQDSTANSQKKVKSEQLRGVQVTGSRIRQVDLAGATPVASITSQQITDQGYANVQELFDNLSYNVGGSLAQNQSFGFTPGASGVDLRGFGVGRTLVLLDGRRLPVYPVAAGGTQNFVDLSAIPTSAVKRVDILTTGGSAIYGSDAISGVINIITKKHYNGFSGSVRVGDTEHGGYANHREQMTYGFSDDKNHIIISGEIYHNNALWANQRFYSAHDVVPGLPFIQNFSTYGASYVDYVNGTITGSPNCQAVLGPAGVPNLSNALYQQFGFSGTFCGFDRAQYRQLYPKVTRDSLYSRFDHDFGWATFYAQGLYSDEGTEVRFEPYPYASPFIPSNAPNAPTNGYGYFYRRMTEFGSRGDNIDNRTLYFVTGLKGYFSDYQWDVGLQRNQVTSNSSFPSIISSVLNNAVCGGYDAATNTCTYQDGPGLNLLDPVPASVVSAATYLRSTHAISQNTTFDAQINGPMGFSLPGGDVQFSAYTSYTKEWYSDINDPITASGQGVDGAVSAQGKRGHVAGALEFSLPVVKMLTLNVAGRYDKYLSTGVGGLITGQGGLEFRPVRSLLIRGSIGNQFRAPDMQRVFGGATKAFESAIDSVACKNAGGTVGQAGGPAICNNPVQSIPVSSAGNRNLKAEKGTTYSFGFVYEPIDRLTLTSDYYYIALRGGVQAPTAQFILNSCAQQGALCNLIHRDSNGNLGPTSLIVEDPINTSSQSQKGLDNTVSYDFGISPVGRFRIKYSLRNVFKIPHTPGAASRWMRACGHETD